MHDLPTPNCGTMDRKLSVRALCSNSSISGGMRLLTCHGRLFTCQAPLSNCTLEKKKKNLPSKEFTVAVKIKYLGINISKEAYRIYMWQMVNTLGCIRETKFRDRPHYERFSCEDVLSLPINF